MNVDINWCFFDDETHLIPPDASNPIMGIPDLALVPQPGDVVFISPRSSWIVVLRAYQQTAPDRLLVQVWLGHHPAGLVMRRQRPMALVPPTTQP